MSSPSPLRTGPPLSPIQVFSTSALTGLRHSSMSPSNTRWAPLGAASWQRCSVTTSSATERGAHDGLGADDDPHPSAETGCPSEGRSPISIGMSWLAVDNRNTARSLPSVANATASTLTRSPVIRAAWHKLPAPTIASTRSGSRERMQCAAVSTTLEETKVPPQNRDA